MKAIMVVGTTSHAGKSTLVAGLCRLFWRKGWLVTPFQAQNMTSNAYVTTSGGQIGYTQAFQSWASKTVPRVEMNPILLKPQDNNTSQLILRGELIGIIDNQVYAQNYFDLGWQTITDCLNILGQEFDLVICEGAGNPAEIYLKHHDLTNMRVATHLQADTILVADIERGGAFSNLVGTLELLEMEERALVKGIIINKFKGDVSSLDSSIERLENLTNIPVLGVLPWFDDTLPFEDSLSLLNQSNKVQNADVKIKIIKLPNISNFTDFDPLEAENNVFIEYINLDDDIGYPDAVIIPDTKTTMADLRALEASGMKRKIQEYERAGGTVFGICGGYKMLGHNILNPDHFEEEISSLEGLDLLPIETILKSEKISRQREVFANYPQANFPVDGYEIHQGYTELITPLAKQRKIKYYPFFDDPSLGLVNENLSVWGCYLHGIFDNGAWRRSWLNYLRHKRGLSSLPTGISNYRHQRELLIDSLADFVERNLNLEKIWV
ncbi:MAG: cobyric acid synthase CobQ [Cyanobacterium sp. T60_A2020_053]|nr:cobyric acid synthase CobQ [Cyanobacterium sp. T60_A2020_053]